MKISENNLCINCERWLNGGGIEETEIDLTCGVLLRGEANSPEAARVIFASSLQLRLYNSYLVWKHVEEICPLTS